jgi:hypothetical protein
LLVRRVLTAAENILTALFHRFETPQHWASDRIEISSITMRGKEDQTLCDSRGPISETSLIRCMVFMYRGNDWEQFAPHVIGSGLATAKSSYNKNPALRQEICGAFL